MAETRRTIRCAIYTRKSSEEGLEQDFNSLHAQREACEAFITSQKHEGWQLLAARYDDGGYSGGNMERPGLTRLLADIASGSIDVVVVYKVDRLTRSLTDFARIVEVLDRSTASFVSVTQSFNTTTSMGRLTLNVLLSFAQFEREVTGERIRDKIAASKKKGLWMGGHVPFGYDAAGRTLVLNTAQAETVRTIYRLYLELRSVDAVKDELDRRGIRTSAEGPFSRGHLYRLLENPIYIGRIRHKATIYKGQHPALIDRSLWDLVQALLAQNRNGQPHRSKSKNPSLFAGLMFDREGRGLLSTHAVKRGVRYRYYVSPDRLKRQADAPSPGATPGLRLAAAEVEDGILALLKRLLRDRDWLVAAVVPPQASLDLQQVILRRAGHLAERLASDNPVARRDAVLTLLQRIDLRDDEVQLILHSQALGDATTPVTITRPLALRRRGVETKLIIEDEGPADPQPDAAMVRALAQAHRWWRDLLDKRYPTMKEIAQAYRTDERYVARIIPLAFLPAQLTRDILNGTQPPEMTLVELMAGEGA